MAAVLLIVPLKKRIDRVLAVFMPQVEGFSATPYWDIDRYSWGYGTPAPGPNGTITRAQAFADMVQHYSDDYPQLSALITRKLRATQWAALLSFSYNTGIGNADNLVANINSGDDSELGVQWNKYVYAGGVRNSSLVQRRALEWQLWQS